MAWFYLIAAGLFEIGWPVGLKLSQTPGRLMLGVTIAMVEQNAKQALAIAHKGFVLANGANSWTDTGKALLANPEVARSFLGGP